jgi:hypothetical protein
MSDTILLDYDHVHRPTSGMWKSRPLFGEISKGLVERGGNLVSVFHAFHSPGISTALLVFDRRRTVNRWRILARTRPSYRCSLLPFIARAEHQSVGYRGAPFLYAAPQSPKLTTCEGSWYLRLKPLENGFGGCGFGNYI